MLRNTPNRFIWVSHTTLFQPCLLTRLPFNQIVGDSPKLVTQLRNTVQHARDLFELPLEQTLEVSGEY